MKPSSGCYENIMNELARLEALNSYSILDTLPQKEFDDITELASIICGTPVSLITFLDSQRQWFKSKIGMDLHETPREQAFCHHAIQEPHEVTIIEDSFKDERFKDNPLAKGKHQVRFYAGAPLITSSGHALGTLCVIDHKPRTITKEQERALSLLSKKIIERLEQRKANLESERVFRQSNHKFFSLTEQSPHFIAVLNDSLVFTYTNKGYEYQSREELIGISSLSAIAPKYKKKFSLLCQEVLQKSKSASLTIQLINRAAGDQWVSCYLCPLVEEGLVTGILMTYTDITQKVNAEAKEKASRADYKSLYFNNPNSVAKLHIDGTIEDINESTSSIYGYSKDEIIGQNFMRFIDPSFLKEATASFKKALKGKAGTFESRGFAKTGAIIDIILTIVPVVVEGKVIKLQAITRDITESKRAQNIIKEQAEAQSSIFESLNEGFLGLDNDMQITYLNNVCATILQNNKEELLRKNIFETYPTLKTTMLFQRCEEVRHTGEHVHFRETFPISKKTLDIDIYPTKSGLAIHFLDVTDKVIAREDFENISFVAGHVKNAVFILSSEQTVTWANESFLNLIGTPLEEAKGKKISELLGAENANLGAVESLREKLKAATYFSERIRFITREGKTLSLKADITPALDEQGKLKQYFAILSDYTQLKEAQDELRQQADHLFQQNKDLQEFTYIVSHNLRAPVANILGMSHVLTKMERNLPTFDTGLQHLATSAAHLDTVLKDMNMILSVRDRKSVLGKEQVDPIEIWEQTFLDLKEPFMECEGKATIDMQDGIRVQALRAYLYSVFHNLLSNAIKYKSDERSLHIHVRCYRSDEEGTVICFTDNGSGFDRHKAGDNVFKLYKRFHTDREGRGIGLYLVKTHLEAMDGRIEVSSMLDTGTEFRIFLP